MKYQLLFIVFLTALIFPIYSYAQEYIGKVVGISDGDTFTFLVDGQQQIKIRMAEIDAPEKDQAFGEKSKYILSGLIFNKTITVVKTDIDKYGRTIGRAYDGNIDINLELVKLGAAWAYRQYLTDDQFIPAEIIAKNNKVGLWALQDDHIIPPWEWRHSKKNITIKPSSEQIAPKKNTNDNIFVCSEKTLCGQMVNCAEAQFYLKQCGLSRLDGDNDGMPCESICR